ncbi:MAG TPA: ATPase domain-containing protein [Candidatus Nanoarchaeia archaeon]|nr:ATPase domain-containing protein [Candidatus Nanoarchaeia archaeon]
MGLLEKLEKGEIGKNKLVSISGRSLPSNLVPSTPPEEKVRVKMALETGKMQISNVQRIKERPSTRVRLPRTPIGIPLLDKITEGGFIRGSVNLIGGGPGSGKSIFCMQYLVRGIENGENGVFVSFEQSEEKIRQDMARFGWKLEEKIAQKKLAILYFTPEQIENILQSGSDVLKDMIEYVGAKRLVIDSLNAFALLHSDESDIRKAVIKLFDMVHKMEVTTLATLEQESDENRHQASVLEFETDSVILVYNRKSYKRRARSLEIYKMRGTKHAQRTFPMEITKKGIVVGKDAK